MRLGHQVGADQAASDVVPHIQEAERAGLDSAWTAGRFEALTQLALAAPQTSRIELGTAVVSIYQRHPAVLAQQALTIQSASGGRHALGIGVSHRFVIEGNLGFEWRPIRQMREYLSCLVPLLRGESVTFDGQFYRLTDYRLPLAAIVTPPPPVLVAALGPQMLGLTGQLADGTIIFLGGPRYLREVAVPVISQAARTAGRPSPRIVAGVPVMLTTRSAAAVREAHAADFASYEQRPSYRRILDLNGSSRAVDVAIIGDEAEVRARFQEYAAAGVTDFLLSLIDDDAGNRERTLELLADAAGSAS